jgi:hypothetical protein
MPYHFVPLTAEYTRSILQWKYDGPYAIKVYELAGFVKFSEHTAVIDDVEYKAQRMKKRIE